MLSFATTGLLFAPVFLPAAGAGGGDVELVFDINDQATSPNNTVPQDFAALGGAVLFQGQSDQGLGEELFIWTGNPATSGLLADIQVGEGSSRPRFLTTVGGLVFFSAVGPGGRELWASDGTAAGTYLVKDLAPGSSMPQDFFEVDGLLYFTAFDPATGRELWRSDGTEVGTFLLLDPGSSSTSSNPRNFGAFGSSLVFTNNDFLGIGSELWISDGTLAGTSVLFDVAPGGSSSSPAEFVEYNGWLYFAATVGGARELYRTDGAILEQPISFASDSSGPRGLAVYDGLLYFGAFDGASNSGLWRTDGTQAGTELIVPLTTSGGWTPGQVTPTTQGLFFTSTGGPDGNELWFTDGTLVGTVGMNLEEPGVAGLTHFTALGANLAFLCDALGPDQIWISDGTLAGTQPLTGFASTVDDGSSASVVSGGTLFFGSDSPTVGNELFSSDGTLAGTALVTDLSPGPSNGSSSPKQFTRGNGLAVFVADDGAHGDEPWRTDGTAAGTYLLADLYDGAGQSDPSPAVLFDDRFYFAANLGFLQSEQDRLLVTDGSAAPHALEMGNARGVTLLTPLTSALYFSADETGFGREPWITDGTDAGTTRVDDLYPGPLGSSPLGFVELDDGTVLFSAFAPDIGRELWKTDGATVSLVADLQVGPISSNPVVIANRGDVLFFAATTTTNGRELWVTDGSAAGTHLIDIVPGAEGSSPESGLIVDGLCFFPAGTPADGIELWASNGSSAGTQRLSDAAPGSDDAEPVGLTAFGNGVLFRTDETLSSDLWISDGTPAGTLALLDNWTPFDPGVNEFVVAGPTIWAIVRSLVTGYELWKSDGTVAGTQLVSNQTPGGESWISLSDLHAIGAGAEALFIGDSSTGTEVWRVDGSGTGPQSVGEVVPGPGPSDPQGFHRVGGSILLTAETSLLGRELYRIPMSTTAAWVLEPYGAGCPGSGGVAPRLAGSGPALVGGSFDAQLSDAAPAVGAALFWSTERAALPVGGGCKLYFGAPFEVAGAVVTDGSGAGSLTLPIPNLPVLAGLPVHFQYGVIDPLGPIGATLTGGLEAVFGG